MSRPPFTPRKQKPKERRTATAVCAGNHDQLPPRDILTAVLTNVKSYKIVEKDEEMKRAKRQAKKLLEKERKRSRVGVKVRENVSSDGGTGAIPAPTQATSHIHIPLTQTTNSAASAFWRARPAIHIPAMQRSVSVTPPPMPTSPVAMPSSPASTPGPSSSSSTSCSSSKRPRTPDDDEDLDRRHHNISSNSAMLREQARKRRVAVRKGWKGWVEGSPPPSEKLINLDAVPILQERRTRSGKSFDAIGVGKEGWV
jgi:hypothetical protein